jgi:hypothetical protein
MSRYEATLELTRRRYLRVWLVLAVLGLVGLGGALAPLLDITRRLNASYTAWGFELKVSGQGQAIREAHQRLLEDIQVIEKPSITPKLYVATMVQQVSGAALTEGITVTGATPVDQAAVVPTGGPYRLAITVTGRYPQLVRFVDRLQRLPKAVALVGLKLRADPVAADGTLVGELQLVGRDVPDLGDGASLDWRGQSGSSGITGTPLPPPPGMPGANPAPAASPVPGASSPAPSPSPALPPPPAAKGGPTPKPLAGRVP